MVSHNLWSYVRTLQGERTQVVAMKKGYIAGGARNMDGDSQECRRNWRTKNGAVDMVRVLGQVAVTSELMKDISSDGFRKQGTTTNYNNQPHFRILPAHDSWKEKKDLYLQAFLECRCSFTPMVYSAEVIPGVEALAAQRRLAPILIFKLKWEYSGLCGFVRARTSLEIVRSNILLLRSP